MQAKLFVIAGINGAGKTSVANKILRGKIPIINPDEIVLENNLSSIAAGKKALEMRRICIVQNTDFAIETTLSGKDELQFIQLCKTKGYAIYLIFVHLDSLELAKKRVFERSLSQGHWIADGDIERRYPRTIENLKVLAKNTDDLIFLDNSNEKMRCIFQKNQQELKIIDGHNMPKLAQEILENLKN